MSDLLDMAADIRRAVELSTGTQADLAQAAALLKDAVSALQAMLASTTQPDAHHAVALLAGLPSELDTLGTLLHQTEELLLTYLDKLGVSRPASPHPPQHNKQTEYGTPSPSSGNRHLEW